MIICTMAGGGVNTACTGFKGDVLPQNNPGVPIIKGMAAHSALKVCSLDFAYYFRSFKGELPNNLINHFLGHDDYTMVTGFNGGIGELGMEADRQVGRQGPGSCCPDGKGCRLPL